MEKSASPQSFFAYDNHEDNTGGWKMADKPSQLQSVIRFQEAYIEQEKMHKRKVRIVRSMPPRIIPRSVGTLRKTGYDR